MSSHTNTLGLRNLPTLIGCSHLRFDALLKLSAKVAPSLGRFQRNGARAGTWGNLPNLGPSPMVGGRFSHLLRETQPPVIFDTRPKVMPKSLEDARKSGDVEKVLRDGSDCLACEALNSFLVAYHMATGELFGGGLLKRLAPMEFFGSRVADVTLVCPSSVLPGQEAAINLLNEFADMPRGILERWDSTGRSDDVPEDKLHQGRLDGDA